MLLDGYKSLLIDINPIFFQYRQIYMFIRPTVNQKTTLNFVYKLKKSNYLVAKRFKALSKNVKIEKL